MPVKTTKQGVPSKKRHTQARVAKKRRVLWIPPYQRVPSNPLTQAHPVPVTGSLTYPGSGLEDPRQLGIHPQHFPTATAHCFIRSRSLCIKLLLQTQQLSLSKFRRLKATKRLQRNLLTLRKTKRPRACMETLNQTSGGVAMPSPASAASASKRSLARSSQAISALGFSLWVTHGYVSQKITMRDEHVTLQK